MVLRIFKMIATSGFLTALECTKVVLGWGSAPDPSRGAYSALSDTLACLREPTSMGEGMERKGKGRRREGTGLLTQISGCAPVYSQNTDSACKYYSVVSHFFISMPCFIQMSSELQILCKILYIQLYV